MFINEVPREVTVAWEKWFCFGCIIDQPLMTKVVDYSPEDYSYTGEMYLCDTYAERLYQSSDFDQPPLNYDKYGIYFWEDKEGYLTMADDDGTETERYQIATVKEENMIIPSKYIANFEAMFDWDQFLPPWMRQDDGHSFTVVVVDEIWR